LCVVIEEFKEEEGEKKQTLRFVLTNDKIYYVNFAFKYFKNIRLIKGEKRTKIRRRRKAIKKEKRKKKTINVCVEFVVGNVEFLFA